MCDTLSVVHSLRWRRFLQEESGAALVEFSIVAMLLIVLVFGAVNWSQFFFLYGQMADAVRDGARYAATRTETAADVAAVQTYVRTVMENSTTSSTLGTVDVTYSTVLGARRVRVALTGFPFQRVAPFGMGASRTITVAAEQRRELP